jgi:hypothetical protein
MSTTRLGTNVHKAAVATHVVRALFQRDRHAACWILSVFLSTSSSVAPAPARRAWLCTRGGLDWWLTAALLVLVDKFDSGDDDDDRVLVGMSHAQHKFERLATVTTVRAAANSEGMDRPKTRGGMLMFDRMLGLAVQLPPVSWTRSVRDRCFLLPP